MHWTSIQDKSQVVLNDLGIKQRLTPRMIELGCTNVIDGQYYTLVKSIIDEFTKSLKIRSDNAVIISSKLHEIRTINAEEVMGQYSHFFNGDETGEHLASEIELFANQYGTNLETLELIRLSKPCYPLLNNVAKISACLSASSATGEHSFSSQCRHAPLEKILVSPLI